MQLFVIMNRSDQKLVDGDGGVRITGAGARRNISCRSDNELRPAAPNHGAENKIAIDKNVFATTSQRRPAAQCANDEQTRNDLGSCQTVWVLLLLLLSYGIFIASSSTPSPTEVSHGRKATTTMSKASSCL
jgi:hypothetical protein